MPRLQVRVGNSIDTLYPIPINATQPTAVQNDSFDGFISVHIRDHEPPSTLLDQINNNNNAFCIAITGKFLLQGMTTDDILFGNQFERALRLPTGTSLALRFAHWFDPGLEANLYASQPRAFSPLVVTMNRLQVQHADLDIVAKESSRSAINEDVSSVAQGLTDATQRRAYFANAAHRQDVAVKPDQVWSMLFTNPYIDFNKFVVHLPMLDVDVLKYWDGQPLRYYAKTRDDMTTFFIVEFNLMQDDN
ncbi:hypothetical protein O0I10_003446 [Lichtheimia ornata]|uniref:Domain of unknown function at the cortex 1 domain-containing protein n=1 Tax=Lichtheimia ornata TaxID=688661 RepID=A0AAD7Y1A7_9FUNG|nr:uncharacterized protein O0I10_003446 [Lichtheimia ornata]KAJ8660803.1 hypothetical protein O0I10_003446 [Lichtheimia ornata]